MTSGNAPRSVFGAVDQDRVLAGFDRAVDDGLDSSFFAEALTQAQEDAVRAVLDADLVDFDRLDGASRRDFILNGPSSVDGSSSAAGTSGTAGSGGRG